jgi:hypothetical protein
MSNNDAAIQELNKLVKQLEAVVASKQSELLKLRNDNLVLHKQLQVLQEEHGVLQKQWQTKSLLAAQLPANEKQVLEKQINNYLNAINAILDKMAIQKTSE